MDVLDRNLKPPIPCSYTTERRKSLRLDRPTALPAWVYRVSLTDGTRRPWREFAPSDPAGTYRIAPVFVSENGSAYACNALRNLSDLYIAEGLR